MKTWMVLNVHLDESTGALRWLKPYTERLEGKNNAGMRTHLLPYSAHESETDTIPPRQAHALTTVRITPRARARLRRRSWRQALALADPVLTPARVRVWRQASSRLRPRMVAPSS